MARLLARTRSPSATVWTLAQVQDVGKGMAAEEKSIDVGGQGAEMGAEVNGTVEGVHGEEKGKADNVTDKAEDESVSSYRRR